jgi:pSer/pThr/pTyr-binding forkhead associated (FHA) protein
MWHLLLLDPQGKEFQRYPIGTDALTIGRSKDRKIVLNSSAVSRQHAQLVMLNGQPVLIDEGSANGSRLNGRVAGKSTVLKHGDEILIAEFRLRVENAQMATAAPDPLATTYMPSVPLPPPVPGAPAVPTVPVGSDESRRFRSAKELLEEQMAGIRSFRNESSGTERKTAEFELAWKSVMVSLRDLRQQLQNEKRVMYFTIDREDREVNVKLADPKARGGGILLSLSRRPPEGQTQEQFTVWIRVLGERDATYKDPQEALERFVQRIATRLA